MTPAAGVRRPCGLVVDSGAVLSVIPPGVVVVPLGIEVGGRVLLDGLDISLDEVYSRIAAGEAVRTSTPSPGQYLEAFRACDAEHVVCLTMSAQLSAMYSSATVAARLLAEEGDSRTVDVIDTGTAAAGFGLVARSAALLVSASAPLPEVLERVRLAGEEAWVIGSLSTLAHLARSGRVPRLIAGLGDLVGVRPIFELRRGEARRLGLVRGQRRVQRAFVREALGRVDATEPVWLVVSHAAADEEAARVRAALHGVLRVGRSELVALSPVLGSYTGPGMIGFAVMPLRGSELAEVP